MNELQALLDHGCLFVAVEDLLELAQDLALFVV